MHGSASLDNAQNLPLQGGKVTRKTSRRLGREEGSSPSLGGSTLASSPHLGSSWGIVKGRGSWGRGHFGICSTSRCCWVGFYEASAMDTAPVGAPGLGLEAASSCSRTLAWGGAVVRMGILSGHHWLPELLQGFIQRGWFFWLLQETC